MKFFAKFNISNALDRDRPGEPGISFRTGGELGEFRQKIVAVDAALKRQVRAAVEVPDDLHESIMGEVTKAKSASLGTRSRRAGLADAVRVLWPRWASVGAAGVLALALGWFLRRDSQPVQPPSENIASAAAPLFSFEEFAKSTPAEVTAPLATELDRVRADLDATARFLLANVP
jgi:hypothetical protein